jgi:hypothetical protein
MRPGPEGGIRHHVLVYDSTYTTDASILARTPPGPLVIKPCLLFLGWQLSTLIMHHCHRSTGVCLVKRKHPRMITSAFPVPMAAIRCQLVGQRNALSKLACALLSSWLGFRRAAPLLLARRPN